MVCTRCRGIVGWWDFEPVKYKTKEERGVWSQEELDALHKPKENPLKRKWTERELKELA